MYHKMPCRPELEAEEKNFGMIVMTKYANHCFAA